MFVSAPAVQGDGITQDEMVLRTRSWQELHAVYRRLGGTADGVVAGAFTDKVSELLADRWRTVGDLQQIVRRDAAFRRFVLANINEAVPADRAKRIESNIATGCPDRATQALCDELLNALETARRK